MIKTLSFSSGGSPANITTNITPIGISRQDAFACLYDAYADRIQRIVLFRVADDKLAEEITADVFLEAWEQLPEYQTGKTPIIAWLYGLTQQVVVEYFRTRESLTALPQPSSAGINPEPGTDEQLQLQIMSVTSGKGVRKAGNEETLPLQTLSQPSAEGLQESTDHQPPALILGFIGELSASEIALQLDKQQEATQVSQVSSLRELVKYLTSKEDEPTPLDREMSLSMMV